LVLYDHRISSPAYKLINEVFIAERKPALVTISVEVVHEFKSLGAEAPYLISVSDTPYNYQIADQFRIPRADPFIACNWALKEG
jgi:dTDP-4-dehydrorhamnose 3,5-epimerase-like enzyme